MVGMDRVQKAGSKYGGWVLSHEDAVRDAISLQGIGDRASITSVMRLPGSEYS